MKTIQEKIAVMQAYQRGEPIEVFIAGNWRPLADPSWNWGERDYQIKQSLEEKVFETYIKVAYPCYQGSWSPATTDPMRAGLRAVIELVKKEGLS